MNKLLKSVIGLTAIPLIGGVLAGPAVSETRELRYAMGHPPGSFVVDAGQAMPMRSENIRTESCQ